MTTLQRLKAKISSQIEKILTKQGEARCSYCRLQETSVLKSQ